jgi:hypothetical protein
MYALIMYCLFKDSQSKDNVLGLRPLHILHTHDFLLDSFFCRAHKRGHGILAPPTYTPSTHKHKEQVERQLYHLNKSCTGGLEQDR